MLAEWLEKEAQGEMVKTAAQQFEEELSILDKPSLVRVWREAKAKEAAKLSKEEREALRYQGAIEGGALGGGVSGVGRGMLYGAQAGGAPGAALGGAAGGLLGGLGGALGGHAYESEWGKQHPIGRHVVPVLAGGLGGWGGAAMGARLRGGKEPPEQENVYRDSGKEKKSSVDLMRAALAKNAMSGEEEARRMIAYMQAKKARGEKMAPGFEQGAKRWVRSRLQKGTPFEAAKKAVTKVV